MKEVILKFREIAVDGFPSESMECIALPYYGYLSAVQLPYSKIHSSFNVRDYDSVERVLKNSIRSVAYWMPLHEFNMAFKEEQNENLD